jgi:hypothetical protein
MAGEWSALLKAVASPILRWLPGWALRSWYPVRKCSEYLTVSAPGVGPHIYVNAQRSPAIANWNVTFVNGLPFPVKVEGFHLEFNLESRTLTNAEQAVRETIPAGGTRQIGVSEIHLSDGQARIVRQSANESPILSITGHVSCGSVVGEFKKNLQMETRIFIYRGDR